MNLIVRVFGYTVLQICNETDDAKAEYDLARDLSGGTTSYDRIDAGEPDCFMGFTNGRSDE